MLGKSKKPSSPQPPPPGRLPASFSGGQPGYAPQGYSPQPPQAGYYQQPPQYPVPSPQYQQTPPAGIYGNPPYQQPQQSPQPYQQSPQPYQSFSQPPSAQWSQPSPQPQYGLSPRPSQQGPPTSPWTPYILFPNMVTPVDIELAVRIGGEWTHTSPEYPVTDPKGTEVMRCNNRQWRAKMEIAAQGRTLLTINRSMLSSKVKINDSNDRTIINVSKNKDGLEAEFCDRPGVVLPMRPSEKNFMVIVDRQVLIEGRWEQHTMHDDWMRIRVGAGFDMVVQQSKQNAQAAADAAGAGA
ncbi:MAG: hypothetical protein Q9162_002979 [Coniocarpon cinnabarinum]